MVVTGNSCVHAMFQTWLQVLVLLWAEILTLIYFSNVYFEVLPANHLLHFLILHCHLSVLTSNLFSWNLSCTFCVQNIPICLLLSVWQIPFAVNTVSRLLIMYMLHNSNDTSYNVFRNLDNGEICIHTFNHKLEDNFLQQSTI